MTITSRGAVAPTGDRAGTGPAATAAGAAPLDAGALSATVDDVADHAASWAKTDAAARADLLERVIADTMAVQDEWLAAACAAKGLRPGTTEAGEELFTGIGTFVRMARLLRDALRDIAKDGKPAFAGPVREAADGRLRVQVFPSGAFDRITFPQTTAEIYMQPGVTRESLVAGQAAAYADPLAHAGTALVLAAGNVASLGPRDVLSKLFVQGKVVVMKANPVNDYLVPYWSRALAALVDAGVLRIVDGGAAVGQYLTGHSRIDEVHITGSDKTYDAVVFGTGPEGARRKAGGRARPGQAGHGGVGQRLTGDRGAGQVVHRRAALPGRARGHHAGEQRRLQLRLGPPRRHARGLAPARGLPRGTDPDPGRPHPASGLLPGRRRPAGRLRGRPPRGRGIRRRPGRRTALDVHPGRPPGPDRQTSASTWSRSSGRWPRRP